LNYSSDLPWFTKQAKWMYKMALAFMIICCLGFSAFVLDLMCEEDVIRLFYSIWQDDVFDFYWQIALAAIFLFILIQAGFSAALMSYSERVWDKDSEDSPRALLVSLFAWFPVLGWIVCSRPTSDVEDALGQKNSEHPDYDSFVSRGRGVRRSLRFYHVMSILIVLVLLTSRFNKTTLITIAMLFLFAFVFVSISWFRYAKRLTQSQELANIEN
jgi:ABC-type multidrug transport system fused ATPase/permease subunit